MLKILRDVEKDYVFDSKSVIFDIRVSFESGGVVLGGETNLKVAVADIVEKIRSAGFSVCDRVNLLPDAVLGKQTFGVVCVSVANLCSAPSHRAELVSQVLMGATVKVFKVDGDWFLVQTPDEYISWVEKQQILLCDENGHSEWKEAAKVMYFKNRGVALGRQSAPISVVSDLVCGDLLKVNVEEGDKYNVELPDGRHAMVMKEDVVFYGGNRSNTEIAVEAVLDRAFSLLGVPYLWGGASSKMLDCSGFVQLVFLLNGVLLKRDASQQATQGDVVSIVGGVKNFQRGDLLFFVEKEGGSVSHVAIYMGESRFIHASGCVRVNSFDSNANDYDKFRHETLFSCRRIII